MRRVWAVLAMGLLAGCAADLAERQAELTQWVGQPETHLAAATGAPNRVYDSGGMKFLTYEQVYVEQEPSGPYIWGRGRPHRPDSGARAPRRSATSRSPWPAA